MASGAEGGIPGNNLGQCFTSSNTLTHLLGVSGAPTGTVGGAADDRVGACDRRRPVPQFALHTRLFAAITLGG